MPVPFDMRLPVIAAPMFLVSGPELVLAACRAGIGGAFPTPNARPIDVLEQWVRQITEGLAAIRKLFEEEVVPVKAIFTPDSAQQDRGDVVVEGPAHGDFPGSPLRFTYRFTLVNGAIETLEISL